MNVPPWPLVEWMTALLASSLTARIRSSARGQPVRASPANRRAKAIAQAAQRVAPRESSAFIQATAQEGRAWARLGDARETYDALARVEALVSPLPAPEEAEHHYRYDPAKSGAYLATTLSWIGDPGAEGYARQVLAGSNRRQTDGRIPGERQQPG
jgi:hypothetical protein